MMTDTGDITGKIMAKKEFKEIKPEQIIEVLTASWGR